MSEPNIGIALFPCEDSSPALVFLSGLTIVSYYDKGQVIFYTYV